jgi:mono/diheme cytochrome c family protein
VAPAANRSILLLIAWACSARAHDVISTKITWSQEISRIVYAHCAGCHRDGTVTLLTYQQVRPWAKAIKEEVHERRMPPWGAMKGFGEFKDDNSLTTEEIHLIADWVEGGAPEGDLQYLPPVPPARPAVKPPLTPRAIRDGFRLPAAWQITAIGPAPGVAEGASLQAAATLPDGTVVPLMWLFNFQPKRARTFAYREPVRLPAGTTVRISGAASVRVAVKP